MKAAEERTEPAILIAVIYAKLGLAAEMFEWLETGGCSEVNSYLHSVLSAMSSVLIDTDPRYHAFLRRSDLSHLARS